MTAAHEASSRILLPGDRLPNSASLTKSKLGTGLHLSNNTIIASVAGELTHDQNITSIARPQVPSTPSPKLPYISAIVHARVTRISTRQAHVTILAVDNVPCSTSTLASEDGGFTGIIRQQDVRATEKDKVLIKESFSVGDVVRAEVISLGDERSYYLTTARNELGVVLAWSEQGAVMMPVSWREVVDVGSGRRCPRKVARVEG